MEPTNPLRSGNYSFEAYKQRPWSAFEGFYGSCRGLYTAEETAGSAVESKKDFCSAYLMCFIFNTAFAARAREQFGERTSLLEILRPSPLFKVQKLTINVTKPSYPFPTVVPQHSEDQVGVITKLLLLSIKRRKVKTMYKKKILNPHPFLQYSMKNTPGR